MSEYVVEKKLNDSVTVTGKGETVAEVFDALADVSEILGIDKCGKCDSHNLILVKRVVDGNEFREIRCLDCGAVLGIGSHKTGGTLFPKKKNADGEWIPDGGWQRWNKEKKAYE